LPETPQPARPVPDRSGAASWAAFAGCCAVWGSTFLAIRIGNESLPPVWAATLRLILASAILGLLARLARQPFPRGPALRAALLYGLFQFGIQLSLLYGAETVVSSGVAAVLYATIPILTALWARALGQEVLSPRKLAGAAIALGGMFLIFSGELRSDVPPLPLLAIFAGAASASLAGVLLKQGPPQPSLAANAVGSVVGMGVCLAASWAAGEPWPLPRTWASWWPVLYLTLAGSVVAFGLFAWLLNRWSATRASFIAVVVPVVAVLLGVVVRDERLPAAGRIGSVLVLAGVSLALSGRRPSPRGK
jgi:drug/metabolite transporter (DMT)-like permease